MARRFGFETGDLVKHATGLGIVMVIERFSRVPFAPEPIFVSFWNQERAEYELYSFAPGALQLAFPVEDTDNGS